MPKRELAAYFGAPRMTRIALTIEGDLCGPMSIGTVAVIRALQKHLGLSLAEACEHVNHCVFEGQRLMLASPSPHAAEALRAELSGLPAAPRIRVAIVEA